jgi:hypothetical protein
MTTLSQIWAALHSDNTEHGWLALPIHAEAVCALKAGVYHPDHLEGLLLDVPASSIAHNVEYPDSKGFEVKPERLTPGKNGLVRIALTRTTTGNKTLFAILAEDIAKRVAAESNLDSAVSTFFARIKAWQAFMQAHNGPHLTANEELGAIGELLFLNQVLLPSINPEQALAAWQGPTSAPHDFRAADHGIEIKSTDSPNNSVVRIANLDQLDEQALISLHLVVVKLAPRTTGQTLPDLVDLLRNKFFQADPDLISHFDGKLLQLGYVDSHRDQYQRRLELIGFEQYRVQPGFPRLTFANVPAGIPKASYEVDLANAQNHKVDQSTMINTFLGTASGT